MLRLIENMIGNVSETLQQMQQLHGLGWKVLVKLHPTVQQHLPLNEVRGITIVDDTYTVNDYLMITDVLITDYSSIPYESCLLSIPTFLYTPDYERYNETQGVIPKYPGLLPVTNSSSFEDVLNWIKSNERLRGSKEAMQSFLIYGMRRRRDKQWSVSFDITMYDY